LPWVGLAAFWPGRSNAIRRSGTQPFKLGSRVDQDWVMVRSVAGS
jgi:hypothetical protein